MNRNTQFLGNRAQRAQVGVSLSDSPEMDKLLAMRSEVIRLLEKWRDSHPVKEDDGE